MRDRGPPLSQKGVEEFRGSTDHSLRTAYLDQGQPIGVTVHCTQQPIREQPLSSQPSQKTPPGFHRSTNHRHATQQNGKHHFRHAQHFRLSRYGIEDCFTVQMPKKKRLFSSDVERTVDPSIQHASVAELKPDIKRHVRCVKTDILNATMHHAVLRFQHVVASGGSHIEHIM
ncbi:hypothetical protein TNCV_524651 [Trichonephila clavipes]|nr:hypothetical protein TNCV_524651 [Trichonephila clavipes]